MATNVVANILRLIGYVWITLGSFLLVLILALAWYREGFGRLQTMLNPHDVWNWISVGTVLGPGLALPHLADGVRHRRRGAVLGGLAALVVAVALFAVIAPTIPAYIMNTTRGPSKADSPTREHEAAAIRVPNGSATMNQPKNQQQTNSDSQKAIDALLAEAQADVRLMTPHKWAGLTESEVNIYAQAFLETMSFVSYGYLPKDRKDAVEQFSTFTRCAETEDITRWRPYKWPYVQDSGTAADDLQSTAALLCEKYMSKGDTSLRAVRLISRSAWQAFSPREKAIYLMGYIETGQAYVKRIGDREMQEFIRNCVEYGIGLEGILGELDHITYEWQYPLPWSISRAVGVACKRNR